MWLPGPLGNQPHSSQTLQLKFSERETGVGERDGGEGGGGVGEREELQRPLQGRSSSTSVSCCSCCLALCSASVAVSLACPSLSRAWLSLSLVVFNSACTSDNWSTACRNRSLLSWRRKVSTCTPTTLIDYLTNLTRYSHTHLCICLLQLLLQC